MRNKKTYIKFSILSLAPQILSLEIKSNGKVLKKKSKQVNPIVLRRLIRKMFRTFDYVSVNQISYKRKEFREEFIFEAYSYYVPVNNDLVLDVPNDVFYVKGNTVDVRK